ncbi:MAG: TonB-dependent receptor [Gemmatimonadetes bacterium]|nr:TonB-dependent receptor [Gemmatimonadota bacterium]
MDLRDAGRAVLVLRAWRRAWVLGLAALLAGAAVHAQTALVVLGSEEVAAGALEEATGEVSWPYGPILYADDPMEAGRAFVKAEGVGVAAILVLSDAELDPDLLERLAAGAPSLRVRVAPARFELAAGRSSSELARSIERAATLSLALLLESGDLVQEGTVLHRLAGINVTASREPKTTFDTPRPVAVVRRDRIRERSPDNIAELFREIPGLDVDGVGPNQRRPIIRGLRGHRVLLLQEGLRLNNSRRQLDSGEPPAIGGVFELDRVEVVRGPTSVLYGSDAIGGVVNLIPRRAASGVTGSQAYGALQYRYGSGDDQHRVSGTVSGHVGRLGFHLGGSYRDASAYDAPAGQFGELTLARDTRVQDTGVEDLNLGARIEYRFDERQELFARVERYRALDAGFGFVEPEDLGLGGSRVQLLWPDLAFDRIVAGYEGRDMGVPIADRVSLKAYRQSNERDFLTDVWVPFDSELPDGPGVQIASENFTDIDTYGLRAEASRLMAGRHLLTYGLDVHRDRSFNTDSRTETVVGAGPPDPTTSDTPGLPNATLRSLGVFAQGALALAPSLDLTLGLRYQDVRSSTRETANLDEPLTSASEGTLVGAANLMVRVSDNVNLLASIGRGFRSPNLIERFFSGQTPDGTGIWRRNPDLGPETSTSLDLGARLRTERVYFEGFVFGTFLQDGIQLRTTGEEVDGSPVFQNVNISAIDLFGVELLAGYEVAPSLVIEGGFTHLSAENPDDPTDRVMEGYRDRLDGRLRYGGSGDPFWIEYEVRRSGSTEDIAPGVSPIGDTIPGFTVHALRGGIRVSSYGRLGVAIENLGNALFAEPINVAFFRPEPKRALILSWTMEFGGRRGG